MVTPSPPRSFDVFAPILCDVQRCSNLLDPISGGPQGPSPKAQESGQADPQKPCTHFGKAEISASLWNSPGDVCCPLACVRPHQMCILVCQHLRRGVTLRHIELSHESQTISAGVLRLPHSCVPAPRSLIAGSPRVTTQCTTRGWVQRPLRSARQLGAAVSSCGCVAAPAATPSAAAVGSRWPEEGGADPVEPRGGCCCCSRFRSSVAATSAQLPVASSSRRHATCRHAQRQATCMS